MNPALQLVEIQVDRRVGKHQSTSDPADALNRAFIPMSNAPLPLPMVRWTRLAGEALLVMSVLAAHQAGGLEIWNGPPVNFTNAAGSDPADPASQDRLTLNVWLTRGPTRGLYNAAVETSYNSLSPVGTEWAYGTLPDYASLNYKTWVVWNQKNPPGMVGRDAVLHLIPDDAYVAVRFTHWNIGAAGFSYTRSTPPVPEPSSALMMLAATTVTVGRLFHQRLRRASAGSSSLLRKVNAYRKLALS